MRATAAPPPFEFQGDTGKPSDAGSGRNTSVSFEWEDEGEAEATSEWVRAGGASSLTSLARLLRLPPILSQSQAPRRRARAQVTRWRRGSRGERRRSAAVAAQVEVVWMVGQGAVDGQRWMVGGIGWRRS